MVPDISGNTNLNNDYKELERRVNKAAELILNPPEVEVGTAPREVVYKDGKMKLIHYLPVVKETHEVPLLIIYALVNKPYILDLQPDRSVIRKLLKEGFDIYMIDWGTPTEGDKFLTLNDYINWYTNDAVDFIREKHGLDSISILGYCQGGTLSVMFTAIHPKKVKNLILMAAPLDFEADQGLLKLWSREEYFDADKLVDIVGNMPGEFLNFGFLLLDPVNNLYSKYLKFIDRVDDPEFVKMFFRMEKWINDGIPVAGETYREFIKNCYQRNLLVKNQLKLDGKKVNLNNLTMPLLSLVAQYDHLVPPESSMFFNDLVPSKDKELMVFPTGHIGLSVSSATHAKFWPKVARWLGKRSKIGRAEQKRLKKRKEDPTRKPNK